MTRISMGQRVRRGVGEVVAARLGAVAEFAPPPFAEPGHADHDPQAAALTTQRVLALLSAVDAAR
ncbi:hypothetical protein [Cellulomonas triticagri]|uniref:hypothetical protein n=1 Tax=Cellulomonas triticagri TaxID=2483352 RepID=UPI0011C46F0A|nr:hypothetical protein [Cellulomonas triticagri]